MEKEWQEIVCSERDSFEVNSKEYTVTCIEVTKAGAVLEGDCFESGKATVQYDPMFKVGEQYKIRS